MRENSIEIRSGNDVKMRDVKIFLAGFLVCALILTVVAANDIIREVFFGVNVVVDGETLEFDYDSRPFIMDDRTFLPVRGIAEALGVEVGWDNDTQTVYIGGTVQNNYAVIEIVHFGGIEWRVLDVQDGKALLLSEYLLEQVPYHNVHEDVTWETSDIRRWLNNEFYNRFTEEERAQIAETYVINNDDPWFGTPSGDITVDKIFLLSIIEVVEYFNSNEERIAGCTITGEVGWWWLRSPGVNASDVGAVTTAGATYGNTFVSYTNTFVRPAMWVYL